MPCGCKVVNYRLLNDTEYILHRAEIELSQSQLSEQCRKLIF